MKGRKTTLSILVMLVSLSIPAAFSENDNFSVDYIFEPYMVGDQWMIKDTQILEIPGEPLIPYRTARILLPEGAVLKDVKVKHGKPIVQKGFELPWSQPPCTFSDTSLEVERNEETYTSDNLYPSKLFEVVGVKYFRGFSILHVILYPVQYKPKSGTVHFYEKLTVEVKFGKGMKNKLYRGLEADKKAVADLVDNTDTLVTYEDGQAPLATEEYIIITNDTMQSTFQQLANWKSCFVNGTGVYTTSWIYSNYSGTDNQTKIRNFIIDKYSNNGTLYVLLGGDIAIVPYRGFYVSTGGYEKDLPADMYYAHLDGSWDNNGDGRYGEPGEEDWYAEVAVGRAPVETVEEAQNFVNKVIAYEQMDKPKVVVFHQSRFGSGNVPDSRCLAYNCDDYIPPDWTVIYLFEEEGQVTKAEWRDTWALNPLIFVHFGHGNTDNYNINYEVGGPVSWYDSDVSSLTNTFWPLHMSTASHCGDFTANDCLGEVYVNECKAIAFIGNSGLSWFNTNNACMYSGKFIEMMFKALFDGEKEHFGDMLNQGKSYLAGSASSDSYYRWCYYEVNLIGDPETPILTKRVVIISNPPNGSIVYGTVNVTVCTAGDSDEVKFYIDGSLVKDDTSAPFDYSWDTTAYSDGDHTVTAEGYIDGLVEDTDQVTVTVDNTTPYIRITNPEDGSTVSGTVTCTADSNCDSVKWYIDGVFRYEDTTVPFQYSWDTTAETEDADHTVKAEGYNDGVYQTEDSVTVTVDNEGECLGTILLSLLVLFGAAGIYRRR